MRDDDVEREEIELSGNSVGEFTAAGFPWPNICDVDWALCGAATYLGCATVTGYSAAICGASLGSACVTSGSVALGCVNNTGDIHGACIDWASEGEC